MEETSNSSTGKNKRYSSASGSILLPLALKWRLLGFLSAVFITVFVMPCATADKALAAADVKLELTVPKTLSLSVSPDGQLHSQQSDEIEITSDAYAGYTFTLRGSDATKQLKNGTTSALDSITAAIDATTYGGTGYLNTWGYLPSKLNSTTNTKYQPGPTTTPVMIEKTTSANNTANKYTITLGAKVDGTLPTGNYGNTFTLTVTANDVPYTITYELNSGIGGPSTPQKSTGAVGSTVTIGAAPTRQGYEFKGWCDKQTTNETCSGNTYQPDGTYTLTNSANNVTLYAMWKSTGPTDLGNLGNMQSFTCSMISNTGDYGTVTDTRDSNTYKIAKLKDGKCWMIDNLKLGSGLSTGQTKVLTSSDSDVPASGFTMTMTAEKAKYTGSGATRYDMDAAYVDATWGGFYSWHTATAGTGTYAMSSGNASNSICPKGWRLPTGGSSSDFADLVNAYGGNNSTGSSNLRATPVPNFQYSGLVWNDGDGLAYQGSDGYYWSSTAGNSYNAYYLYLSSSIAYPAYYFDKYYGYSVRCVSRQ